MESSPNNPIRVAAAAIRSGEPVVFPTETVYGLGANAWNAIACARIFEIKQRPAFNPLIVHLARFEDLHDVVSHVPHWASELGRRFWPGPLTLVLPKNTRVPDLVTAGLSSVAVRIPAHPIARALIELAEVPIAAPSANRFTRLSPTTVEHARSQLGERVSFYLDGGPCSVGLESTIVGWQPEGPVLLRPGGLSIEAIEECTGPLLRPKSGASVVAPGMLQKHYSPKTRVVFTDRAPVAGGRLGLITLRATAEDRDLYPVVEELSPTEDLREAASRLFAALARLESRNLDAIIARPVPERDLGIAINDRLRRASD